MVELAHANCYQLWFMSIPSKLQTWTVDSTAAAAAAVAAAAAATAALGAQWPTRRLSAAMINCYYVTRCERWN